MMCHKHENRIGDPDPDCPDCAAAQNTANSEEEQ